MTKASHEAIEIVKTVILIRIVRVWLGIVSRQIRANPIDSKLSS